MDDMQIYPNANMITQEDIDANINIIELYINKASEFIKSIPNEELSRYNRIALQIDLENGITDVLYVTNKKNLSS